MTDQIPTDRLDKCPCTFGEPRIVQAVSLMHEHPENQWTPKILARRLGMSPARFARLFAKIVGKSPMQYLTRWRMLKAASLLDSRNLSVIETARRVGYDSEAAFVRAFRRSIGTTPGEYQSTGGSRGPLGNPAPSWLPGLNKFRSRRSVPRPRPDVAGD